VVHRRLPAFNDRSSQTAGRRSPIFLILATDGLSELYQDLEQEDMANEWARCVGTTYCTQARLVGKLRTDNLALRLLRHALGDEDTLRVSQMLTLNMSTTWMDHTTIIVQVL